MSYEVIGKFLDSLKKRPDTFEPFIQALVETDQKAIADYIKKEKGILQSKAEVKNEFASGGKAPPSSIAHKPPNVL